MFFKGVYFIAQPLIRLFYRIFFFAKSYNQNNVPDDCSVIICGNHKSLNDGIVIGGFVPRKLNFMAKKELFANKFCKWFLSGLGIYPVDRKGNDISVVKTALRILKDNGAMVIFPEGTRNLPDINESKDGAVVLALKTKSPIIPVKIDSKYKLFGGMKIVFGDPVCYEQYYDKKLSGEEIHKLTVELMEKIYSLKD